MPAADEAPLVAVVADGETAARAAIAAWEVGEAILPVAPSLPAAARDELFAGLRPTHLIDDAGARHALAGGVPVAAGVAAVIATSGTTGAPKGVELTRAGLETMARGVNARLAVDDDDGWLVCLPMQRVAALNIVARAWIGGTRWTALDGWDAAVAARAPRDLGTTLVSFVPTMMRRLIADGAPPDDYRVILVGGAACPPELVRANVVTTIGMTETWGGFALDGRPIDGVDVRIADDGEILVHGPVVMHGYRLAPDDTNAVLDADGWFHTGDVGRFEDGVLRVTDRKKDIIISGGVNVSPARVEAVLRTHPAIVDVCVVGVPDEEWGERVVAFAVATDAVALADVRAFARDQLPADHLPRELRIVDELPRNPDGKIIRRALREAQS